jgi:hypothetical protein
MTDVEMADAGPAEPRKSKAEEALASAPWVRLLLVAETARPL